MSNQLPYTVEYSNSNRSRCKKCLEIIPKDSLRLAKMGQSPFADKQDAHWYHNECFFESILMDPFFANQLAEVSIRGFTNLRYTDQENLRKRIKSRQNDGESTMKKQKTDLQPEDKDLNETIEKQTKEYYELRNKLDAEMKRPNYINILEENDQYIPEGRANILNHVADIIYFGAIKPCKNCNANFIFDGNSGYLCQGYQSAWAKCNQILIEPERQSVKIPKDIQEKFPFLAKEFQIQQRTISSIYTSPQSESANASIYTNEIKLQTIMLKDLKNVDEESGLINFAHVHCAGELTYSITLTKVDGFKNSYYKMQLLESDRTHENNYWVFRSWGRIGEKGNNIKNEFSSLGDAQHFFETHYLDKTGNCFGSDEFVKYPGKYYKMDIKYDEDEQQKIIEKKQLVKSNLKKSVQDLIELIFDEDMLNQTMLEFKLDIQRMPLGKISPKQIHDAMTILKDISELIEKNASRSELCEKSNQFYSLIPHDFGVKRVPDIDTSEMVAMKVEMLETLSQIAVSYTFSNKNLSENKNILDSCYEQLNAHINPIEKHSEDYNLIITYAKNTHSAIHDEYFLDIEDIFTVSREGEIKRYETFRKLHNKKLLWHGSKLANFVGILSKGLKIAPREVPRNGSMFGNGIYFTDTVSKAANYSRAQCKNDVGLMLLCEVALGDSMECFDGNNVTKDGQKLPKGFHSIKGVGKGFPNPKEGRLIYEDVEAPVGEMVENASIKSALLHNEYVVYDEAQVKIKYLIKTKFNYSRK
ncbi:poly [ADP-ribose] polymerase-like [Contarinia nasturtii]|uniref:poly [ADP-ribose] polymerase-like n=1 Tax=Contarinia nasturtii TaxID=265458 RepID=UPI0012D481BD|nr:poly [ADP-ribose] polymerase-like [Contarinia nasturtii]